MNGRGLNIGKKQFIIGRNLNCIEKSEVAQDAQSGCFWVGPLCLVKKILWCFLLLSDYCVFVIRGKETKNNVEG